MNQKNTNLDFDNACFTLSKIYFIKTAHYFNLNLPDMIQIIKQEKNVSYKIAEKIFYLKAGDSISKMQEVKSKKDILSYLLS